MLDALTVDQVETLSSTFDETALGEHIGNAAVAGILLPEKVVRGNTGGKAARADDFDAPRILADEYGGCTCIIPVTDRIQDSFANGTFVECWYVPNEEALLKVLKVVSKADLLPQSIEYRKKALAVLGPVGSGPRCFVGAVLEDKFGLSEKTAQSLAGTEKD